MSFDCEPWGSVLGGHPEVSYEISIHARRGDAWQALGSLWGVGVWVPGRGGPPGLSPDDTSDLGGANAESEERK